MKICVVHPKVTSTSAKKLAAAIGAHVYNPYKGGHYGQYDLVFNYGYGGGAVGVYMHPSEPESPVIVSGGGGDFGGGGASDSWESSSSSSDSNTSGD